MQPAQALTWAQALTEQGLTWAQALTAQAQTAQALTWVRVAMSSSREGVKASRRYTNYTKVQKSQDGQDGGRVKICFEHKMVETYQLRVIMLYRSHLQQSQS